jgi:citrate lyase subunit beta / citryl-CoA lyase
MLSKAVGLPADEIVVDLEDAVAADQKDYARALVASFLSRERSIAATVTVRINALATPWGERDVVELLRQAGPRLDSLIVPKVERPDDIVEVEQLLHAQGESVQDVRLQALVETAAGLLHVREIATASARLDALILGYADLAASLGRSQGMSGPAKWLYAQETVLVAARAAGLQTIDGPYLEIRDDEGLRLWVEHVRALGFDGKWAVHPDQLAIINATFTPVEAEVARARAILDALEQHEERGAVELHGEMIDEASRKLAARVIARSRAADVEGASE